MGIAIPLTQVIEVVWEPAKILRRNRLKAITVGAQNGCTETAPPDYINHSNNGT